MAGENSPQARAQADAYAKKQAEQARLQTLNAKVNTPIIKVNTKNQAVPTGVRRPNGGTQPLTNTASTKTGPDDSLKGASDYDPNSALNKSWNTPNGGIQNPKFIYPGNSNRDAVNGKTIKIERGYIRRLTEFYEKENKQTETSANKSTASTIKNMKCNFQFNPDNITRMVTAESDMQFFFNQDPSQLAQPIPGKAGFAFELLFNREAEVASQRYLDGSGALRKANFKEPITNTTDYLDPSKPYDPSWVAHLGVLADILILDDVIGQGLAKDIYNAIQNGQKDSTGKTWGFSKDSPNSPTNPTGEDTKKIDQNRYDAYSMNIGNKAFLTPTPVRVLFTKWMMVEGFIQSIQVTFNKFSAEMIPTQATVMIQMQALYMGFAQQNTFLTQLPNIDVGDNTNPVVTTPGKDEPSFARYTEYDDDLKKKNFFDKHFYINYQAVSNDENVAIPFKSLFSIPNNLISSNAIPFAIADFTGIGANGEDWINKWKKQGKNFSFVWDGVLKVYWDSHVVKSTGLPINRPSYVGSVTEQYIGPTTYKSGVPTKQNAGVTNETDFSLYGTKTNPWVFKTEGNTAKYHVGFGPNDYMETAPGATKTTKWKDTNGQITEWEFALENGRDALINTGIAKPFEQDKFTIELGIRWRVIDDIYPDQPVWLYDWHHSKITQTVGPLLTKEWFLAERNGDYRTITAQGQSVQGTGVTFFKSVGM